jgi:ABC-type transporter Mla maintaining outer membrane lipid asymmetry permease subunit MlaE
LRDDNPRRFRFGKLYAIGLGGFATPLGALLALQSWLGLQKFGGVEYAPRVVFLSAVRSLGPGASGTALLLAFVLWAHRVAPPALAAELPRISRRALLIAIPGYALGTALVLSSGLLACALLGVPLRVSLASARGVLHPLDFLAGAASACVEALLIVALAWRFLRPLMTARLSLPAKLVIVLTATVPLRAMLGLVVSSFLPG